MIKRLIKETITKFSANLGEIMENNDELTQIYNSREFLTTLFNDLVKNKRNVVEWKVMSASNNSEDASLYDESPYGDFKIDYDFDFIYNYYEPEMPQLKAKKLKLTMFINGSVAFTQTPVDRGNYFNAPSGGEMNIDYKNLGNEIKISLFDNDGIEINTKWVTPELKKKVVAEVMKDYV